VITIDHSWSHTLDPALEIVFYQWNLFDHPEGLDLNGDGDFDDQGEFPPEDLDGDGVISFDEIVWEFETEDANERFYFSYDDELGWGEQALHRITLAVTDNRGEVIHDDTSLNLLVSLSNQPPIIQAHPEGRTTFYQGYIGAEVIIDPRSTFDPDSERELFPGDGERPQGIQDYVSSLHLDLNFDGRFTEEESALNFPVSLILQEEMAVGDLVGVLVRACDDGQWNGECFDGVDADDCSLCSYEFAIITLEPNIGPPMIDIGTCDPITGECAPYESDGHPVEFDLGGSFDPEGVSGLRFWYEILEGEGWLEVQEEYQGRPDDMGPNPIYHPDPDGTRVDRIRVTVTDRGGLSAEEIIRISVANQAPEIIEAHLELEPRAPLFQGLNLINLGDGWYRAVASAHPDERWDASVQIVARDPGDDPLTYSLDLNSDGEIDLEGNLLSRFILDPSQAAPELSLYVADDEGLSDELLISYNIPSRTAQLSYSFDLGGDGSFDSLGALNYFDFWVEPGVERLRLTGLIQDDDGLSTEFDEQLLLNNEAPIFEVARILEIDGFRVTITASATDPNHDSLSYRVDWGDGSAPMAMLEGAAEHLYPDTYTEYQIHITADDGRGASATRFLELIFEEGSTGPIGDEDRAPIIEDLSLEYGAQGRVNLFITAHDPEGGPLSYSIHWGTEAEEMALRPLGAPQGAYHYPFSTSPYEGFIEVEDIEGLRSRQIFNVELQDRPTEIISVTDRLITEGRVLLGVEVEDGDGVDQLLYRFDFDGDGSWDTEDQAWNREVHSYARSGEHHLRVRVTDSWSGAEVEATHHFELAPWQGENQAPIIHSVDVSVGPAGLSSVVVDASDPEGEPLEMMIHWGDEEQEDQLSLMEASAVTHSFRFDPQESLRRGYLLVRDPHGASTLEEFELEIRDRETLISEISLNHAEHGRVMISLLALDEDSDALRYSFDFEADGLWEIDEQLESSSSHRYEEAGIYTIQVSVLDPWSGNSILAERLLELSPWLESVVLDEDHLQVEEGECLALYIEGGLSTLRSEVDPRACELHEETEESLWSWSFGDGGEAEGVEVGHRYLNDGVYDLLVQGGSELRPVQSLLQVQVINAPPSFRSQAPTQAQAGEEYLYNIHLDDPGELDLLKLSLEEGPQGMRLERGHGDREWQLSWSIPDNFEGDVEVILIVEDGRELDGAWSPDGASNLQWFHIKVEPKLSEEEEGLSTADGGVAAESNADVGLNYDPENYASGSCACDLNGGSSSGLFALFLLLLPLLRRSRS